jgi:Bacterial PH domain
MTDVTQTHGPVGGPALPVDVHRQPVARVVAVTWWVVCALLLLDVVLRGHWPSSAIGALVLVLAAVFAYAVYWRPAVVSDPLGVTLHNPLRDIRVPWDRVTGVGGRWSLDIRTEKRAYTAFAAAPKRRRRSRRGEIPDPGPSPMVESLSDRWERALAAGDPSNEPVQVRWAWEVLAPGAAAAVALVLVAVLA